MLVFAVGCFKSWSTYCLLPATALFTVTVNIWRPFLHPEPEDAQCRVDRDPLNTEDNTIKNINLYNNLEAA